jgi:hypothetical protein
MAGEGLRQEPLSERRGLPHDRAEVVRRADSCSGRMRAVDDAREPGSADAPAIDVVRQEIEQLLAEDQTRMGDVYRLNAEGKSASEIAERLGIDTSGFVSNYKSAIAALLDGEVPRSPTLAAQVAARVRSWLKKPGLSRHVQDRLTDLQAALQIQSEDSTARSVEDDQSKQRTAEAERTRTPGIYVYTLPHYLRHPYDPDSGRTLLKVGRSERDTYDRAYTQGRITALPEDPILLRVYPVINGDSASVERNFHGWLTDADHERSRSLRGGSEWFLTSTKFLDRVARSQGLAIHVVTDFETVD